MNENKKVAPEVLVQEQQKDKNITFKDLKDKTFADLEKNKTNWK